MDYIEKYLHLFLSAEQREFLEYEIRFGTKTPPISRSNYENVLSFLKSQGFQISNPISFLRMKADRSDIRTDIQGVFNIQNYCKQDNIDDVIEQVEFSQKSRFVQDGEVLYPHDYEDFGFRVSLQEDRNLDDDNKEQELLQTWNDRKKIFRLIKRISATNPDYPGIRVDMSVIKSSKKGKDGSLIPEYTVKESGVLQSSLSYEIEIEYTSRDRNGNMFDDVDEKITLQHIKTCITHVLRGIQDSYFPISYSSIQKIKQTAME